jgi:hypothetical protein
MAVVSRVLTVTQGNLENRCSSAPFDGAEDEAPI